MVESWQELKKELEDETKKIFLNCPDEIKRFHYGIITHSDAGKHALNQYFGHWVHSYAGYFYYCDAILPGFLRLAENPDFDLKQLKIVFLQFTGFRGPMSAYGGQKTLTKYAEEMVQALDTLQTKEQFVELLKAWNAFVSRLYWWVHWYFPWGIGPALCPRLSAEDIKEIVRLSESS